MPDDNTQNNQQPQTPAPAQPAATPAPETPATPTPASQPVEPVQPAEVKPTEQPTPAAQAQPAAAAPTPPQPAPTEPPATPATPVNPTTPTTPTTPAAQPTTQTPEKTKHNCPVIDAEKWDKQRMQLNKMFYKTFSPKIFYYPFSFAIDMDRAMNGAKKAGYTVPENPMVLDTGGMFLGNIMVEVQGANEGDKNVVSFMNKEVYTKASKVDWKDIKKDITALETELGAKPKELYMWYTACPECVSGRECKTILIAVP